MYPGLPYPNQSLKPIYMKPLFNAVYSKLILGTIFVMALATARAQSAAAGDGQNEIAMVKYLGTQEDMIVFNVSYPNPEGSKFQLIVKDQDGSQIYQNSFNDKSFFKQFMLPKADKDRIVFVFRNGRDADIVKTFEVSVNSRYVREVAVKKLD
jgi:hypothetical protein